MHSGNVVITDNGCELIDLEEGDHFLLTVQAIKFMLCKSIEIDGGLFKKESLL